MSSLVTDYKPLRTASLSIEEIAYSYGSFDLGPVSFDALPGSIVGLIGPNGAGKTTLLSCMGGVLEGSAGRVALRGSRLGDLERRKNIGFASARNVWYKDISLGEHLSFLRSFYPAWSEQRASSLVSRFGLPLTKKAGEASAGMLAKLALVAALARGANAVLFDEPWNALDPSARVEFTHVLQSVAREYDIPVIVSSHELANVEQICDALLFLRDGRILAQGNKEELRAAAGLSPAATLLDVYVKLEAGSSEGAMS